MHNLHLFILLCLVRSVTCETVHREFADSRQIWLRIAP